MSLSRLMLMSPCMVMEVVGLFVYILSIAVCAFVMKSLMFVCGLRYRLMMVWIGFALRAVVCIWMMIVSASGILMSSIVVVCIQSFM